MNAAKAIEKTAEFFRSIGITQTLSDFGIDDSHFEAMAEHVTTAWVGDYKYAFVPMDKEAVLAVLRASL